MRILYQRYGRDVARYNLAARMLRLEARTLTVHCWTGLPKDRIRNLYQSYLREQGARREPRHRGPPPQSIEYLLKSASRRKEAMGLTGLLCVLQVLPAQPIADPARELPGVARGERLCRAFEIYRGAVTDSKLTLDHAALLLFALVQGVSLQIGRCVKCGSGILVEPLGKSRRVCSDCWHDTAWYVDEGEPARPAESPMFQQQVLL